MLCLVKNEPTFVIAYQSFCVSHEIAALARPTCVASFRHFWSQVEDHVESDRLPQELLATRTILIFMVDHKLSAAKRDILRKYNVTEI